MNPAEDCIHPLVTFRGLPVSGGREDVINFKGSSPQNSKRAGKKIEGGGHYLEAPKMNPNTDSHTGFFNPPHLSLGIIILILSSFSY